MSGIETAVMPGEAKQPVQRETLAGLQFDLVERLR